MADAWEARLRAEATIKKLLALATGTTNTHERDNAMERAQRMAERHGINLQELQPAAPLSADSKLAQARRNAANFAGIFNKSYTGQDTEDYTKYEEERKQRAKEREERERRDTEDWDY